MKQWGTFFEDALKQFETEFPLPRTIFYTADDNVMKWFDDAIREVGSSHFTQDEGQFVVKALGNAFLNKFVQVLEPDFQDPFLSIETIFANKFTTLATR
jgi:hypothetical protein